jgi:hypothetical protein
LIPVFPEAKEKCVQTILDTEDGLWCGIESSSHALMVILSRVIHMNQLILNSFLQVHPHHKQKAKMIRNYCYSHNRSHHDYFLNYRVKTEGVASLVCHSNLILTLYPLHIADTSFFVL